MKKQLLHGRSMTSGVAEGEAIVTTQPMSWCGGVDPMTGTVTELGHSLRGENVKGKILVFHTGKGSSAFSHATHVTRVTGSQPAGIVVQEVNPQVALGSVVMHIPAITDCDADPCVAIRTGDWVKIDADRGVIEITAKS